LGKLWWLLPVFGLRLFHARLRLPELQLLRLAVLCPGPVVLLERVARPSRALAWLPRCLARRPSCRLARRPPSSSLKPRRAAGLAPGAGALPSHPLDARALRDRR